MNTYTSIPKNRIFILLFLLSFTSLTGAFSVSAQTDPPLSITKSGPITAVPGELITYEITYQNQSAFIQKDVVITDIIDLSNATYVSSNPAAIEDTSVPDKLKLTWNKTNIPSLENLNAGENVIFVTIKAGVVMNDKDINLTVKPNYAPGEFYLNTTATNSLQNSATISAYNNGAASPTFTTTSTPHVSTTITQDCSFTFNDAIGQIKSSTNTVFMYLVSITNTGNIWNKWDLSGYSTILKGNAPLVSFNDINGNPITSTVGWTAPGATTTFYLILTADQGTNPNQWANTFVTASSQIACAADLTTRFDTYICGGNCGSYELMYTYKFDHQDPVQSGSTITYTIVIQNSSDAILSNVVLTESYPIFTSFLSSTPPLHNGTPISYTLNTSNNQWSFVNLPIGMTTFDVTLQLNEDIPNNTVLTNLLTLTGGGVTKIYSETTTVKSAPDLSIEKWIRKADGTLLKNYEALPSDEITYIIKYKNLGNYKATNVVISDNYDENYMEVVNANGGDYTTTPGNIKWTISEIPRGSTEYTITYTLRVRNVTYNTGVTTIRNSVDITSTTTGTQDSDYNNNFDETTVSVEELPDLKIEKTVDISIISAPADNSGTLTYTLTVSNTGNVNHTGAYTVTDYLPVGVTYVSSNPNATTVDNGTITWELSDALNANSGTIKTFIIIVSGIGYSLAGDILENRATVYSIGTNDADDNNNEDTAETYVYPNVWVGATTSTGTDWGTADNWTYGIPGTGYIKNDVVFATETNNPTTVAPKSGPAKNNLIMTEDKSIINLTNESDYALHIPSAKSLTITGTAFNNAPERLLIQSTANLANGSLIFTQPLLNQNVQATVQMYSKAYKDPVGVTVTAPDNTTYKVYYKWQYFGIPVQTATFSSTFEAAAPVSYVRVYDETLNDDDNIYYNEWTQLYNSEQLEAFKGYEITQNISPGATKLITFKGALVTGNPTTGKQTLTLTKTPNTAIKKEGGYNIFGNSFTAAIDITKMTFNADVEKTVYLYNTGSLFDWQGATLNSGAAGSYMAVPNSVAGTGEIPREIPSMQGFMLFTITPGATVDILYPTAVSKNTVVQRTPSTQNTDLSFLTMDVVGKNGGDRVWLFSQPKTSHKFDNGWDGRKISLGSGLVLYADEGEDLLQVSTSDDLDGTYLALKAGSDTEYTLRINKTKLTGYKTLYLTDLETNTVTDLSALDEINYTFTATNTTDVVQRFLITSKDKKNNGKNGQKVKIFNSGSTIRIDNQSDENGTVLIFDMFGQLRLTAVMNAASVTEITTGLAPSVYVVRVQAAGIDQSGKIVIRH